MTNIPVVLYILTPVRQQLRPVPDWSGPGAEEEACGCVLTHLMQCWCRAMVTTSNRPLTAFFDSLCFFTFHFQDAMDCKELSPCANEIFGKSS